MPDLNRMSLIRPEHSLSLGRVDGGSLRIQEHVEQLNPLGVRPGPNVGRVSDSQQANPGASSAERPSPFTSTREQLGLQTGARYQNRPVEAKMLQTRSPAFSAALDDPPSRDIDMHSDDEDVDPQFSQDYVISEPEGDQIMRSDNILAARFPAFSASSIWTEDRILREAIDALESPEARRYGCPLTMNEPGKRWANLNKEISKAARAVPFFDQSAIHLAKQCSILVNSHSKWASQFENVMQVEPGKRSSPKEMNHFSTVQFGLLVAEEILERDLTRILELLSILAAQPAQAFQETRLFPQLFTSAWDYLIARRLFANHTEEDVFMRRIKLQKAIRYDLNEVMTALGQKGNWAPDLRPTTGAQGLPPQGQGMQQNLASLSNHSPRTEPASDASAEQPPVIVADSLSLGSQNFSKEPVVAQGSTTSSRMVPDIATTAVTLTVNGIPFRGTGTSIPQARDNAARRALQMLGYGPDIVPF